MSLTEPEQGETPGGTGGEDPEDADGASAGPQPDALAEGSPEETP